jgi:deazaflavin-dependent oxidoreductase (nitroreductase family)
MPDANDWNEKTITEFRANGGRVGGVFEGAPLVLVHHQGRKSGREHVTPTMYLPDDADDGTIYVFATKAGAPSNPDWYYNLTANGAGTVEPRDRTRAQGRRARPHLRRAGAPVPGLRRLRAAHCRHPYDPGPGIEALLRSIRRIARRTAGRG